MSPFYGIHKVTPGIFWKLWLVAVCLKSMEQAKSSVTKLMCNCSFEFLVCLAVYKDKSEMLVKRHNTCLIGSLALIQNEKIISIVIVAASILNNVYQSQHIISVTDWRRRTCINRLVVILNCRCGGN